MKAGEIEKMVIENANLLSSVDTKLNRVAVDIAEIKENLANNYVQKNEFTPVRNISYGLVAGTLMTVLGFLLTHVFG